MKSSLLSLCARRLMPMVAIVFAMIAFNGCGGEDDHAADTHEAGEHDEADEQTSHDELADDENAEVEHDEAGHDEAEEGEHEQGHGEEAVFSEPHNYAEAIHVIHEQLEKIEALIDSGKLDKVHAEAAVIRDVANTLAKFALMSDSGIPQEAIREINLTARVLAATFEPIDEAGDSGDLAGTRKVYDEMVELFESLERHVVVAYVCPMNCEEDKAFTMAGDCTVCGMARQPVVDEEHDDHG